MDYNDKVFDMFFDYDFDEREEDIARQINSARCLEGEIYACEKEV